MQTECTDSQLEFQGIGGRTVLAAFTGGTLTSDGGGILLREVDRKTGIVDQFIACFVDGRDPRRVQFPLAQLVRQRVFALALGYEDVNDHEQLRHDPMLAVLSEADDLTARGAGKSTLNRLELGATTIGEAERYKKITLNHAAVDRLMLDVFVRAHAAPPTEIVLDLDATDVPLHGAQEGRFFHGYYGHYCYLPLYIFAGDHLLCARLRTANQDASAGALDEVQRLVAQLRTVWPDVRITLRADSGFCRDELMTWCESHRVDFVFGLARNARVTALIADELAQVAADATTQGAPVRRFAECRYQTLDSWTRERRVVAKAEHLPGADGGKSNPRFVVTSLAVSAIDARALYEDLYCARGEMENRIKEQQLMLFAGRTSTSEMRSNQFRLYLSAVAYLLFAALRRLALASTALARAQCSTIRLTLCKLGARIRISVRKVWIALPTGAPQAALFAQVHAALRRC